MNRFNSRRPYYNDDADYTTNAPSYYEDLARKHGLLKELSERVWGYDKRLNELIEEIESTMQKYADKLDEKIDDFDSIILEKTEQWLDDNMEDILTQAVQIVWFGLDDTGHFMAVIPENWSHVRFDTTNEGQLMLIN